VPYVAPNCTSCTAAFAKSRKRCTVAIWHPKIATPPRASACNTQNLGCVRKTRGQTRPNAVNSSRIPWGGSPRGGEEWWSPPDPPNPQPKAEGSRQPTHAEGRRVFGAVWHSIGWIWAGFRPPGSVTTDIQPDSTLIRHWFALWRSDSTLFRHYVGEFQARVVGT
jgi:hypothetical protein